MRRSNATTLQDVANEVGVSAMIASVVLNGARSSTRVSETTRARVLEAAARLKYRPNAVARGLSRQLMDSIGVVCIIDGGEINLYFLEVLNGILEGAGAHGQNATVFSLSDWRTDEGRILQLCDGRVDGMILIAPHLSAGFTETLPQHTPFVTIHSDTALPNSYNLDIDNEGGAYAAVRYLISQGHRRILHFSGGLELIGARQRLAGYRRALAEANIPFEDSLVVPCGYSIGSGRFKTTEYLDLHRSEPLPTAIFCGSDAIAYGCMEALASCGIRVPDDISIAGFDDTFTARMTTPPLTTVRQPFRQMGRRAVELLLLQIREEVDGIALPTLQNGPAVIQAIAAEGADGQTGSPVSSIPFPHTEICAVELVLRGSVGPPPERPIVLAE